MLLQTLCRRVLVVRRSETLLTTMYAKVLSRIAAEAAQQPRMVGNADLLRPRLCVSWPSGLLRGQPDRLSGQEQRSLARHGPLGYPVRVCEQRERYARSKVAI